MSRAQGKKGDGEEAAGGVSHKVRLQLFKSVPKYCTRYITTYPPNLSPFRLAKASDVVICLVGWASPSSVLLLVAPPYISKDVGPPFRPPARC